LWKERILFKVHPDDAYKQGLQQCGHAGPIKG
jgi:hypothetical protein